MKKIFAVILIMFGFMINGQTQARPDSIRLTIVNKSGKMFFSKIKLALDTVPCTMLVSNIYRKVSATWTVKGYAILTTGSKSDQIKYLGRNKKPIPSYIYVWDYKVKQ